MTGHMREFDIIHAFVNYELNYFSSDNRTYISNLQTLAVVF